MDLQNPLPRFRMLLILAETIEHVSTSNVSPNIIEPFETESVALREGETYVAPAPGAASCVRVELLGSHQLLLLLLGSLADKQPSSVVIHRL